MCFRVSRSCCRSAWVCGADGTAGALVEGPLGAVGAPEAVEASANASVPCTDKILSQSSTAIIHVRYRLFRINCLSEPLHLAREVRVEISSLWPSFPPVAATKDLFPACATLS